ncbi:MAG: acetate/propionate family kinase [Bauldia sp.]|nr:acetate/propionate family kinase [Bauldia sp.]
MRILILNSGSSSLKYKLYEIEGERVLARGAINVGATGPIRDHREALSEALAAVAAVGAGGIDAIGHRVVHGGEAYSAPAFVDDRVRRAIADNAVLAPLHNPANLLGIDAAMTLRPGTPQVAVFDTAFHRTIPPIAATYPLPRDVSERYGIRRYGFHGTSCAWSVGAAAEFLQRPRDAINLIIAHLGAGASVTAIRNGKSVETSMGLSPLEGVMMQTRAGDLDPAILLLLLRAGMPVDALDRMLNHESGVMGISGDADMLTSARRAAAGDGDACFAREMYSHRVAKYVGAYAGLAWPLDAIVFTGGVGENDAEIRRAICERLPQLGLRLDPTRNEEPDGTSVRSLRSGRDGPELLVVEADEELEIAREAVAVLRTHRPADG